MTWFSHGLYVLDIEQYNLLRTILLDEILRDSDRVHYQLATKDRFSQFPKSKQMVHKAERISLTFKSTNSIQTDMVESSLDFITRQLDCVVSQIDSDDDWGRVWEGTQRFVPCRSTI